MEDQSDRLQQIVSDEKLRLERDVFQHAFGADIYDNIYIFLSSQIFRWFWAKETATICGLINSLGLTFGLNFALETVDSDVVDLTSLQFD